MHWIFWVLIMAVLAAAGILLGVNNNENAWYCLWGAGLIYLYLNVKYSRS
jgi:hypothetical protein